MTFTDTFDFTVVGRGRREGRPADLVAQPPGRLRHRCYRRRAVGVRTGAAHAAGWRGSGPTWRRQLALWIASAHIDLPPVFTGFDGWQTHARHLLFLVVAAGVVLPSAFAMAAAEPWRPAPCGVLARLAAGAALASYGVYLWHQWVTTEWFRSRGVPRVPGTFPAHLRPWCWWAPPRWPR